VSASQAAFLRIGGHRFHWGARTLLMGIVNATPDSFSGDGVLDPASAAEQARAMVEAGADLIDVGAESTRPGHAAVDAEGEWARLGPVLRAVRAAVNVPVTVDTSKAAVAERAFEAGADALNDVSGLRGDPAIASVLASSGRPAVLMHSQRGRAFSGDVIADIRSGLRESLAIARAAGVEEERVILDPGFGFGWEPEQNLAMLRRLGELRALGRPLLIGTSRKSTIGAALGGRPESGRLWGTAASVALAIEAGADIVRVHDVAEMYEVVRTADAAVRGWPPTERRAWLALGGNLGDRVSHLRSALDALVEGDVAVELVSRVFETPPWGVVDQPRFVNIAVAVRTNLSARDLLALAKRIEAAAGRDFSAARNSARPIDVDILAIEGEQVADADLVVPHAGLADRAFVLLPLADVAPDWRHPALGRTVRDLLVGVDAAGIEVLEERGWWSAARASV
jgi:dihydropteroate synthase